jgi:O-antigen ligase
MPPQLATLIFIFIIAYLFRVDFRTSRGSSKAVWIPIIWMFFGESRFPSQWLNIGAADAPNRLAQSIEGSPTDAIVFFILIVAGVLILRRRRINWSSLFTQNIWIWLFFLFAAVSIFWSDYPFISLKRLIKSFGNIIMVLVVLTEKRPYKALGVILKYLTFLLIPLSVLFIKFYPDLGREYHMGNPMFSGISTSKNILGQTCLLSGVYFTWNLLINRKNGIALEQLHYSIYIVILPMITWLFYMSRSATSTACMGIAVCIFFIGSQSVMVRQPTRTFYFTLSGIVILGFLELLFGISAAIITMLGRSPDLTTRVPMWADLLAMVDNPIIGFGYESFWLGARQEFIGNKWNVTMQAHNGYLEMYLNMGLVGVFFLVSWVLSGLIKIRRYFLIDYPVALLRFCFVLIVLIYNWTEATFYGVNPMWMILFLGIMDAPNEYLPNKIQAQGLSMSRAQSRKDISLVERKNSSIVREQSRLQHNCSKTKRVT